MAANLQSALLRLALSALDQSRAGAASPAPDPSPAKGRGRLSTGRAILLGAGLATAGQALIRSRGPAAVEAIRWQLSEQIAPDDAEVVEDPEDEAPDGSDAEPADDERD